MSRRNGKLSALAVKHAALRGIYSDGDGLCLQIARGGSKSWILRYRSAGRRRHLGLGGFPTVTLAEARERAATARSLLQAGKDPVEARRGQRIVALLDAAKTMSFAQAAESYIAAQSAGKNRGSTHQWRTSLATYAFPVLGALPVQAIDTALVLKVLQPIWTSKTVTASRVRGRVESILDWAKVRGYRDGENPARWDGHLVNLLPAPAKVAKVDHYKAMPYAELPAFMVELRARTDIAARALEFTILTAARSGSVFLADWSEIDLVRGVWTISAARMKAGKEHRTPLSGAAVALLEALPGPRAGLIFPGFKAGRPLAKMALADSLKRVGRNDATVHGMRSSFRDWAAERTNYPDQVVEQALAHTIGTAVEKAYRRTDLFDRRVRLMSEWAAFCACKAEPAADVIELRRQA
jgi:integrase